MGDNPTTPVPLDDGAIFACDVCQNSQFASEEDLNKHLTARHSDLFPQYITLRDFAMKIPPVWEAISTEGQDMLTAIGKKTFAFAVSRDGGEEKMKAACLARAQLEVIVRRWLPTASVYIFGSSVAMGIWDGISDIDFTVVDVKEMECGTWHPNEKNAVRSITELLRRAGFSFAHLEPIPNARVPIIKHHAAAPIFPSQEREAEAVIARTVRYRLAHRASAHERLLLEGSVRDHVSPDAVQQVWWNRMSEVMSVTLSNTVEAMRALTISPAVSSGNRCLRIHPASDEFQPELFSIDFDLSFRHFGIRNSVLLNRYMTAHPCARPGALVLKDWSKQSGVNNSMSGFFTSYAVNIMWIYYLVQKKYVPYVDPLDIPESLVANTQYDPVYLPLLPPNMSAVGGDKLFLEMGSMLLGFFYYYCFEFDWQHNVVSLNREHVTTKASLNWKEESSGQGATKSRTVRYQLCIEDPYEENLNLGRHVGFSKERKVMQELYRGLLSLIKDPPHESCVFTNAELQSSSGAEQPVPVDSFMKVMGVTVELVESAGPSGVTLQALTQKLEAEVKHDLALLRKLWSWPQLVHRLGYKLADGVVRPRRKLGLRTKRPEPISAGAEVRPLADLLVDEAIKLSGAAVADPSILQVPEWVRWNPPTVQLHTPGHKRFDATGGILPSADAPAVTRCCAPVNAAAALVPRTRAVAAQVMRSALRCFV